MEDDQRDVLDAYYECWDANGDVRVGECRGRFQCVCWRIQNMTCGWESAEAG